jgi:integrase
MKYAIRHRYVDHNPVAEAERPRGQGEEETPAIRVLKPTEIGKLIEATKNLGARMLFLLAVMSGARQGELFGLKWADVLWGSNQIHIQRTFNNGAWYKPKSKNSVRKIDLGPVVMAELKKWRLACPPNELDLVFPGDKDEDGKAKPLLHSHVLRTHFLPALTAAGLPKIRFHDLRHTYASLLIDQGENIKYIQKQLGHSKPTVTLDIYAHLMDENNPEAADRLEKAVLAGM